MCQFDFQIENKDPIYNQKHCFHAFFMLVLCTEKVVYHVWHSRCENLIR